MGPISHGDIVRLLLASLAAFSLSAAAASTASSGEPHGPAALVELGSLDVPIVDHGRVRGMLSLKLAMEAQDASAAQEMEAALPLLRASALEGAGEFARLYASPVNAVDNQRLVDFVGSAIRRGHPQVRQVLVVESRASG